MTEVTPHPLKTQGFHHFFILLFYDHPAEAHFLVFSAPAPVSAVAFIISYCGYHHTLGSLKKVGTSPDLCWRSCVRSSAARPTMSYPSNSGSRHFSGRCFCAKAKKQAHTTELGSVSLLSCVLLRGTMHQALFPVVVRPRSRCKAANPRDHHVVRAAGAVND